MPAIPNVPEQEQSLTVKIPLMLVEQLLTRVQQQEMTEQTLAA